MDEAERIQLAAQITIEKCDLNHGHWQCDDDSAVDVLVVPMGYKENEIVNHVVRKLTYFLCEACADTIYKNGAEWLLFLCTSCGSSVWKIRELLADRGQHYPPGVVQLMKYCPSCHCGPSKQ